MVRQTLEAIEEKMKLTTAPGSTPCARRIPVATLTDKITVGGARDRIAKKTYIRAKGYPSVPFDGTQERLKADAQWRVYELPCGHDAMVDMPDRLAEILVEVA